MPDPAEDTGAPADAQDGWALSSPEAEGMDAAVLRGLGPHFDAWSEANLHAALIVRHGKLVYERYFTGEDKAWATPLGRIAHHAGLKHDLRSITKSVTSLLAGIAVDRGWLGDLDEPVFAAFPEHGDLRTADKDRITLRHLLTMSAGLAWDEGLPYSNPANSERRMIAAADRCRFVLGQALVRPPGRVYTYNGGLTALLATIIERRSGLSIDAMAGEALFSPLGIADVEWMRYADGTPNAVSGLRMRPRDVAKIGQMVLDGGRWNGWPVVSPAWIGESLTPQVNGEGLYFYGYQWWLGRSLAERREITWAAAFGYGGQRLYVVPELDLVVVVLAGLYDTPALQPVVGEVILRRYALQSAIAGQGAGQGAGG